MKKLAKYEIDAIAQEINLKVKSFFEKKLDKFKEKEVNQKVKEMMKLPAIKEAYRVLTYEGIKNVSVASEFAAYAQQNSYVTFYKPEEIEKTIRQNLVSEYQKTECRVPDYAAIERFVILQSMKIDDPQRIISMGMTEFSK